MLLTNKDDLPHNYIIQKIILNNNKTIFRVKHGHAPGERKSKLWCHLTSLSIK